MKFLIVIACKILVLDDFAYRSALLFHSSCFLLIVAIYIYIVTCYGSATVTCIASLYELVSDLPPHSRADMKNCKTRPDRKTKSNWLVLSHIFLPDPVPVCHFTKI